MKKIALLLIIVLSFAFKSYAIDGVLIHTIDYSFKEKWNNTIGTTIPVIINKEKLFKKQYFYITAIASDYVLDKDDFSNVEYSIKISKPDKSIYFSQEHLTLVKAKIANKLNFQMSEAVIKMCFEEADVLGKYSIEIQIKDLNADKSKTFTSELTLAELPAFNKFKVKSDEEFMKWFENYYENPTPETALSNYLYYAKGKLSEDESTFLPVFSVFLEVFKNNPFLFSQIKESYSKQDAKTKIYLIYLLNYSKIGSTEFMEKLEGDEKAAYLEVKDGYLPDMYGEIIDASQLDMLWATFSAGGSYQPILKLIKTLDYSSYKGFLDKYKTSEKTEEDRRKAVNNAIYDALVWSLTSNCTHHKLVKEYCEWALKFENLTEVQKEELGKILQGLK